MKILSLQVESENADLKLQVVLVTKERDSVIQTNQGLQTKLENLEQVLKVSRIHTAGGTVQTHSAAFGWHVLPRCFFVFVLLSLCFCWEFRFGGILEHGFPERAEVL